MKNNDEELFETSDLPLTATLYLYVPIEHIDKLDSKRMVFGFKRTNELEKLVALFWKNELRVNPKSYFEALKSIKSLIRQ